MNEPPVPRVEQAYKLLEPLTSQSGVTKLTAGLCDEGLFTHPSMNSTIVTDVHDIISSIETNSKLAQKKRPSTVPSMTNIFEDVLRVLDGK